MRRTTLENRETREQQMRDHVKGVAEAILNDTSGDELFAKYLSIFNKVHKYSIGNLLMQLWQAPDSALVASRTAFAEMAKEQGHQPTVKTVRGGKRKGQTYDDYIFVAAGSKAVWIWGHPRPVTYTAKVPQVDGSVKEEPRTFPRFYPAETYQVEDIRYCDTGEPFELPSFATAVEDVNLYDGCLAFCKAKGIEVSEEQLGQANGVSKGGSIATAKGLTWQEQVAVLLHEIAHELLHHSQDEKKLPREVKEAEAEATAAAILQHYGHGIGPQAAYLRNWKAKPQDVLASLDRIAKACKQVIDFIEGTSESNEDATGDASGQVLEPTPAEAQATA